jgi:hypothetical protein
MDAIRGMLSALGGSLMQQYRQLLEALRDARGDEADAEEAERHTLMRYKLDPDERGVLKSSRVADSIRAVTGQEQGNVRRLSSEAQARGEDVVAVNVRYRADIVDGKLAIRAGRTEVVSKPHKPNGGALAREYERIGNANRDAAASGAHFAALDDTALRALSGGLSPEEEIPPELSPVADALEGEAADGATHWGV